MNSPNNIETFDLSNTMIELDNLLKKTVKLERKQDWIDENEYNALKIEIDDYSDKLNWFQVPEDLVDSFEKVVNEFTKIVEKFNKIDKSKIQNEKMKLDIKKEKLINSISSDLDELLLKIEQMWEKQDNDDIDINIKFNVTDIKIIINKKFTELTSLVSSWENVDTLNSIMIEEKLFKDIMLRRINDVNNWTWTIYDLNNFASNYEFWNKKISEFSEPIMIKIMSMFNLKGDDLTEDEIKVNPVFREYRKIAIDLKRSIPKNETVLYIEQYNNYLYNESIYELQKLLLSEGYRLNLDHLKNLKLKNFDDWKKTI